MTFTEAAAQVLRLVGKPLHYKEITDVAIEKNLLSHVGKSPEVTMGARLAALAKKADKENPLVRVKPGVFALREWDKETVKKGLADNTPPLERIEKQEAQGATAASEEVAAEVVDAQADDEPTEAPAEYARMDSERPAPDADEQQRAEFAAEASGLFAAEEDDDDPIFASEVSEVEEESKEGGGRRRRRRRRRGRGTEADTEETSDLPSYTVSDAPAEEVEVAEVAPAPKRESRRDRDRDRDAGGDREPLALEDGAGEKQADLLAAAITRLERGRGGVPLQQLLDAAKRGGESSAGTTTAQFLAIARADNLRQAKLGRRPRFRLLQNRLALEDAATDDRLASAERDVYAALERYRGGLTKSLQRSLSSAPQRAVGELVLVVLEQLGLSRITPVRRPGTHGAELHFSGIVDLGFGEVPTAVVIRRDGREIGRERVTELRGAIHHYGPASQGWLITTGQVLSGAREEAKTKGAAPIALIDGQKLAELCVQHGVGVLFRELSLPVLDSGLFDALRS